jgi:hypothetical protein
MRPNRPKWRAQPADVPENPLNQAENNILYVKKPRKWAFLTPPNTLKSLKNLLDTPGTSNTTALNGFRHVATLRRRRALRPWSPWFFRPPPRFFEGVAIGCACDPLEDIILHARGPRHRA